MKIIIKLLILQIFLIINFINFNEIEGMFQTMGNSKIGKIKIFHGGDFFNAVSKTGNGDGD
jgi:hypothetical protein